MSWSLGVHLVASAAVFLGCACYAWMARRLLAGFLGNTAGIFTLVFILFALGRLLRCLSEADVITAHVQMLLIDTAALLLLYALHSTKRLIKRSGIAETFRVVEDAIKALKRKKK